MLGKAKDLSGRLVDRAQNMGGTCTGEHGIGTGKVYIYFFPYFLEVMTYMFIYVLAFISYEGAWSGVVTRNGCNQESAGSEDAPEPW